MVARRFRRTVSRSAFRYTRWLALAAYLIVAVGVQLPLPAAKNSGEAYPCMNHPCGCASAEQCWRHCCCTTLEQRLAWARENHVTPPDYALAEAKAHGIDWDAYCQVGPEHMSRVCRDGEEVHSSCCKPAHAGGECCRATHSASSNGESQHDGHSRGIVLLQALACKGANQNWMGLAVAVPPPAIVRCFKPADAAELAPVLRPHYSSISQAPATPPPRSLCA